MSFFKPIRRALGKFKMFGSAEYVHYDSLGSGGANSGLKVLLDNGTFGSPPSGNLVYSNTSVPAGNTVANNAAETTFTLPSYSIPANSLVAGSVIRLKLFGVYSTAAVDVTKTIQLKIKFNGTTYLATGDLTTTLSLTNLGWEAEAVFVVFSIGASGTIDAQAIGQFATAAGAVPTSLTINTPNTGTQTIDTTAAQALTVTVDWGTASASNSITLRQALIYIENLSTAATAGTFLSIANKFSELTTLTWTSWGASLNVVGFSSTTTANSFYTVIGDLVTIHVHIIGTSNATNFTFDLPFAPHANYAATNEIFNVVATTDSGTGSVGTIKAQAGSVTVTVNKTLPATNFTASGSKSVRMELTYRKA